MAHGRSLELFFVDGTPDGILTAEVFNWTGHLLKSPRTRLSETLKRDAASHTGVYILFGERDDTPLAYIGEAENIAKRIKDHDAKRDWWSDLIVITTAADALNKAHAKYLEARLIEVARQARTRDLENATTPPRNSLSEAGRANMEEFLETLFLVLPALGIDFFQIGVRSQDEVSSVSSAQVKFRLVTKRNGVDAVAVLEGSEFIVQEGSMMRPSWEGQGKTHRSYRNLHNDLVEKEVLDPTTGRMKHNYAFKSPSAAAAVANGHPANGRIEWKHAVTGKTYEDWEAERLNEKSPKAIVS